MNLPLIKRISFLIGIILISYSPGLGQNTDSLINRLQAASSYKEKALISRSIAGNPPDKSVDSSLKYCHYALEFALKTKDDSVIGLSYSCLIKSFYDKAYQEDSAFYYGSLFEVIANRNKSLHRLKYEGYSFIADIYLKKHEYPVATTYYQKSIKEANKTGQADAIGYAKSKLLDMYRKAGNCEDARIIAQEVIELAEKEKMLWLSFNGYRGVGICHDLKAEYKEAEYFFNKALEIAHETKFPRRIAAGSSLLGVAKRNLKKYAEALKHLYLAAEINRNENHENLITSYQNIGSVYLDSGQLDSALVYIKWGLEEAEKRNQQLSISLLNNFTSKIYEKQGDYKLALEHRKKHQQFNDSLNSAERMRITRELEERFKNKEAQSQLTLLQKENQLKAMILRQKELDMQHIASDADQQRKMAELKTMEARTHKAELQLSAVREQLKQQDYDKAIGELIASEKLRTKQRNLTYLIAGLIIILLGGFFYILKQRQKMKILTENHAAILKERKRISTELHDELGSEFTKISLLSEVIQQDMNVDGKNNAQKISLSAQDALQKMGEIVWSLNPRNDFIDRFVSYLRKYAAEFFDSASVECLIQEDESFPHVTIDGIKRRNILLAFKEALHNIVKHALAKNVIIYIRHKNNCLFIEIQDDGKGIEINNDHSYGNGIRNMTERMKKAGGYFEIKNHNGTTILLSIDLSQESISPLRVG